MTEEVVNAPEDLLERFLSFSIDFDDLLADLEAVIEFNADYLSKYLGADAASVREIALNADAGSLLLVAKRMRKLGKAMNRFYRGINNLDGDDANTFETFGSVMSVLGSLYECCPKNKEEPSK